LYISIFIITFVSTNKKINNMRKSFNNFETISRVYENTVNQINDMSTSFLTNVLQDDATARCGELYDERLRIKVEYSFTSRIDVVGVDKVIYCEEKGILVYDKDGGVWKWGEIYLDDKVLIANTILRRFKEDFLLDNFEVFVNNKSVTPQLVDYITALEIQNDYEKKGYTNVGIDEI